ncbi:MAG: M48 family metalloprotease [Burkholderiaceae bacterium]
MIATDMMLPVPKFSARLMLAAALASAAPVAPWAQPSTQPASAIRLPALGDAAGEDFTVGTEHRLGEQIMAELRRDPDYLDDPLLLDYVQSLWLPLLATARARGDITPETDGLFAFETFLVRDRSVNAFALPGGFVGVHLGLIAMTASRDELAAVLSHELSHVTQRHIARSIANSSRQSLVGLAALLLGVLATSRSGNADATQAVIVGSQAAMVQGQLNFSRDMEREADRIGWGLHTGSGFAPVGVAAMFEKLENASRLNDSGAYPYLRSHPLTVERIGEARNRVEAAGGVRAVAQAPLDHQLMQARARVLMDSSVPSLRRQQALDATAPPSSAAVASNERVAALYASALASLQLREAARAQAALDAALTLSRSTALSDARNAGDTRAARALALLQAQVAMANGQPERAWAALDAAPAGTPRPMLLARAQLAFDASRGAETAALRTSTEALQTWVAERRGDATAWALLGQSAGVLGLRLRSLRAEAEARAALGDIGGAMDRLRAAQRQARTAGAAPDFIEASIIDSRLRELNALRRAQLAEARGERGDRSRQESPP